MAYIDPPRQNELSKAFRHRTYETLRAIAMAENVLREMRIIQIHPTTDWARIWENLHATWASDNKKALWYKVIHDILTTHEPLHAIELSDIAQCGKVRGQGHNNAPLDRLRHRKRDLGMDQGALSMGSAHGAIPHT